MDDELLLALNILRSRLTENKMAAVESIVSAESQGSDRFRQRIKMIDAFEWLSREINCPTYKSQEGS